MPKQYLYGGEESVSEWKANPIWMGVSEFMKRGNEGATQLLSALLPDNESGKKVADVATEMSGMPAIQRTAERVAYGDRLTTGRGQTLKLKDDTFDAALGVLPAVGPAIKGAKATAKFLAPKALEMLESYAAHPIYGVQANVVAPKNKQWTTAGSKQVEDKLWVFEPEPPPGEAATPENAALMNWIQGPLKKYIKQRMATPEDEIRMLHDEGITHMPESAHGEGWYEIDPYEIHRVRSAAGQYGGKSAATEQGRRWEELADAHHSPASVKNHLATGKSIDEDKGWLEKLDPQERVYEFNDDYGMSTLGFHHVMDVLGEKVASGQIRPDQLSKVSVADAIRMTHAYNAEMAAKAEKAAGQSFEGMTIHKEYPDSGMKWVKLDKPGQFAKESDAMGHSVRGYEPPKNKYYERGYERVGLDRFIPEAPKEWHEKYPTIENPVEENYLTREEYLSDFKKFHSQRQAREESPEYNVWRDEKSKHPDWVEASGDSGYLSYGAGGWNAIKSGKAEVYSLRDAKGKSHATIEVRKGKKLTERDLPDNVRDELAEVYGDRSREEFEAAVQKYFAKKQIPNQITQIKGKSNAAPSEKYLPEIQDFVKSSGHEIVEDMEHTGLVRVPSGNDRYGMFSIDDTLNMFTKPELRKYGLSGDVDRYPMNRFNRFDTNADLKKEIKRRKEMLKAPEAVKALGKYNTREEIAKYLSGAAGAAGVAGAAEAKTKDKDLKPAPVTENLVNAIIHHESGGNPYAHSKAGAKGLMQLMPATAKELGVKNRYDPKQNREGGKKYIGQLITKYDGDTRKALIAYNWGPGNVAKFGIDKAPEESKVYADKILKMTQDLEGKAKSKIQHLTPQAQEFIRNHLKNKGQ